MRLKVTPHYLCACVTVLCPKFAVVVGERGTYVVLRRAFPKTIAKEARALKVESLQRSDHDASVDVCDGSLKAAPEHVEKDLWKKF